MMVGQVIVQSQTIIKISSIFQLLTRSLTESPQRLSFVKLQSHSRNSTSIFQAVQFRFKRHSAKPYKLFENFSNNILGMIRRSPMELSRLILAEFTANHPSQQECLIDQLMDLAEKSRPRYHGNQYLNDLSVELSYLPPAVLCRVVEVLLAYQTTSEGGDIQTADCRDKKHTLAFSFYKVNGAFLGLAIYLLERRIGHLSGDYVQAELLDYCLCVFERGQQLDIANTTWQLRSLCLTLTTKQPSTFPERLISYCIATISHHVIHIKHASHRAAERLSAANWIVEALPRLKCCGLVHKALSSLRLLVEDKNVLCYQYLNKKGSRSEDQWRLKCRGIERVFINIVDYLNESVDEQLEEAVVAKLLTSTFSWIRIQELLRHLPLSFTKVSIRALWNVVLTTPTSVEYALNLLAVLLNRVEIEEVCDWLSGEAIDAFPQLVQDKKIKVAEVEYVMRVVRSRMDRFKDVRDIVNSSISIMYVRIAELAIGKEEITLAEALSKSSLRAENLINWDE